ncbi:hypothetical protein CHUAL_001572 [Chamberlinius hualienensis]
MGSVKQSIEKALDVLRYLPRVTLSNIRDNPGSASSKLKNRPRGQHGGDTHGAGQKGATARQRFFPLGYEGYSVPFYRRIPKEPYYRGHHLRRQYPPVSLFNLQQMIDMGYIDPSEPIDLTTICNTKLYKCSPGERQFGVNLTDEGIDLFKAKVNIEVQYATESVIAAVERCGGVITTAYYDVPSLHAAIDPEKFFKRSVPIPKRMLPPEDALEYYTDPKCRGYLADPEKIADDRLVLAQKYGYVLSELSSDPDRKTLMMRKDPRQIFYGLEPGWVVNVKDKVVLKPKEEWLTNYYAS